jgi:hypothetical protein
MLGQIARLGQNWLGSSEGLRTGPERTSEKSARRSVQFHPIRGSFVVL